MKIINKYLTAIFVLLLPLEVFAFNNIGDSTGDSIGVANQQNIHKIRNLDKSTPITDISADYDTLNIQSFQLRLKPQFQSSDDYGYSSNTIRLAATDDATSTKKIQPIRNTLKKVTGRETKKDTNTGDKKERKKVWYIGTGFGPFGFPFNDSAYVSTGFFLTKRLALGFFGGTSTIPNADVSEAFGQLQDDNPLSDLPPELEELARGAVDAEGGYENNVAINSAGLEVKLTLDSLLLPIKLRRLQITSDVQSEQVLDRAFKLKEEYEDTTTLNDALDGEEILLLSVGISSKFYAKWGGALEINWITIEQAISQPKELQQIYSLGLFGIYLGFHI